jgi:hypothetical protein
VSVPAERRIPIGPLIGVAGALLLLVSLFLDWWADLTAFTVFEVLDLVLAGLALGAVLSLAGAFGVRLPWGAAPGPGLALPLGLAASVIVVSQLLNDPPAVARRDFGPELGLWLGLSGSLLMLAGGLLSAARISLALEPERRQAAAPPDTPPRRRRHRDAPGAPSEAPTTPVEPPDAPARDAPERPGGGPSA